jgi:ABC-type antimicrobial peptide transport system permease subunit
MQRELRAVDVTLPVITAQTMAQELERSQAAPKVVATFLGALGGLALVLASIGLVLTVLIVLALRASRGSADIGIGSMDVYRPNIDPVALVAIAAVTAVVGVAAAFVPARRAVRMDPLMALRHE